MANFCLLPQVADKFKKDIIEGKINPEKLALMTSAERRAFFAKELGEASAEPVNALFESKLLLKNQQAGMISWAKKLTGITKQTQRDIISRIQRLDEVLNPVEAEAFLDDLVAQRLGTRVSFEEAQKLSELAKRITETKGVGDRMDYGRASVDLRNYYNDIKLKNNKFSVKDFVKNPLVNTGKALSDIAGNAKAINSSLDNSAIFRQGWKTLWSNPIIWARNSLQTIKSIVDTFSGKEVLDAIDADILSRPTYPQMQKAKLAVGVMEEAYPTSLPERIPVLGKLYKASEAAYTGFVRKTRADVFDKMIEVAEKTGVELTDDELKSIGKMVNSLTGRGHLGKLEPVADVVNNVMFSGRLIKSHIDLLTQPFTGAGGSNFVRKQAALNLLKIISGTAMVMIVAKALGGNVETDPRSSDFGKIKVGNTRFDVTGGMGSLWVLAARLIKNSTKNQKGEIKPLNEKDKKGQPKFGATTQKDLILNFFENKLSPAAGVIRDLLRDQTFKGEQPTIKNIAESLAIPLPIKNAYESTKIPDAANLLLIIMADGLGIGANTYEPPKIEEKKKSTPKRTF